MLLVWWQVLNILTIFVTSEIEPLVVLTDLSNGHNIKGNNITLECRSTFHRDHVSMKWETPKNVVSERILSNNSSYAEYLVILEADASNSGSYWCQINHKKVNYQVKSNVLEITVYGNFSFEQSENIEVPENKTFFDEANAEIKIPFKAHPEASEVSISKESGKTKELHPKILPFNGGKYNYEAKLTFDKITKEDLGKYYIQVNSNLYYFRVEFHEKIFGSLNRISSDESGMSVVYQCKAAGDTKPNITWVFHPCKNIQCLMNQQIKETDAVILKELDHKDRGLQVISNVSVNLENTGILKCVTGNDLQISEPVFYIHNGFDIFIDDGEKNINSKTKTIHVGYGQKVYLVCWLSRYKYTPYVQWYYKEKKIYEKEFYFLMTNKTFSDKIVYLLMFEYVNEDFAGNYSCQSLTKTGEIELKSVEIFSKQMSSMYPQVIVEDLNGGHTTSKDDINLVCTVSFYIYVDIIFWKLYNNQVFGSIGIVPQVTHKKIGNTYITTSYLTIPQGNDRQGYYICELENFQASSEMKYVWINEINDTTITFSEESRFVMENMSIEILMRAHPPPKIQWYDNTKNEISPETSNVSNISIYLERLQTVKWIQENYKATLHFDNIDTKDFGNYTIVVKSKEKQENYSVLVNLTGVSTTKIDVYSNTKENVTFRCTSIGYPQPIIEWYFKSCTTLNSCLQLSLDLSGKFLNEFVYKNPSGKVDRGLQQVSYISTDLSERGILSCRSVNSFGQNYTNELILGHESELEIFTENATSIQRLEVVVPKKFTVICATPTEKYTDEFGWSKNWKRFYCKEKREYHYLSSTLTTITITQEKPMEYNLTCNALSKDGFLKSRTLHVKSRVTQYATIYSTNMLNSSIEVKAGSNFSFYCRVKGFPNPYVKWFKNAEDLPLSDRFKFSDNQEILEIDFVTPEDDGVYTCEVAYKYFTKRKIEKIKRSCKLVVETNHGWLYAQISLIFCVFALIGSLLLIIFIKNKLLQRELRLFGLVYFERGDMENVNPNLSIESQAHLLPYNPKWEIPFDKIKIGKQLGSGAFGTTFQAIVDYSTHEEDQTVAVKTVNRNSEFECIKALVSELKIMSHLGKHVNIVNLLGACTKYVAKRELYVILEFCPFGDLLNYVKRYSESFIDQKDYEIDEFNWVFGEEKVANFENEKIEYISSKDFLIWSFQIARGMDYLGSRKIVHGDLAARNVLLCDNKVVKICDFGLSKNMYNYDNYVKKEKGPLPIKWMSIEAIEKGIFSTQSDVWSFGVVLWEIFSLGKVPYPGVTIDEKFHQKLIDGYRMESPQTATTKIYQIMLNCWNLDPLRRPSFHNLSEEIGTFLEEPVKDHYVTMNTDYMLMNNQEFEQGDYLSMVKPPTYDNIVRQ